MQMKALRVCVITGSLLLLVSAVSLLGFEQYVEMQKAAQQGETIEQVASALADRLRHGRQPVVPARRAGNSANHVRPTRNEAASTPSTSVLQSFGVSSAASALTKERIELPADQGRFWLTFVYADNWRSDPETVRLHHMWLTDPRLVECRSRCRVHSFDVANNPLRRKWLAYVGENTPTLTLQCPDGRLIYKASRGNLPADADAMFAALQRSVDDCFRRPQPQPEPAPQPAEPVAPISPLPDTEQPADEPESANDPLWLLAVLGVTGVVGGAILGRKRK